MCADLDEDGYVNSNDIKKWLLTCHVSESMIEEISEEIDSLFIPILPQFGQNNKMDDDSLIAAVSTSLASNQSSRKSATIIAQRKYSEEVKMSNLKSPHRDGISSVIFEKACKRRPNVILLVSTLHYFHMLTNQCRQAMSLDSVELEAINHASSTQFAYFEDHSSALKKRIALVAAEAANKAIEDAEQIEANRFVCIPPSEQERLASMYMSLDKLVLATKGVFEEENFGKFSEGLLQLRRNIISLRALGTNRSVVALELDMVLRLKQLKYQESVKFKEQLSILKQARAALGGTTAMSKGDTVKRTVSINNAGTSGGVGGASSAPAAAGEGRKKFTIANKSKSLNIPQEEWSCIACTFKNRGMILACEICNTPKPSDSRGSPVNSDPPPPPPPPPMSRSPSMLSPKTKSKSYTEKSKPRGVEL
jgi:hypothetical protein